jgi:hypothetical protein
MAKINLKWTVMENLDLREIAKSCGFYIEQIGTADQSVRDYLQKKVVEEALEKVKEAWYRDNNVPLSDVSSGVYVIALDGGLCVSYGGVGSGKNSPVLYIGRGQIASRIKMHLSQWMYDFAASLQNASFKIYMTEVRGKGRSDYFQNLESDLIVKFREKFGDKPLINKNEGWTHQREHEYSENWKLPIDRRGRRFLWAVQPLPANEWFKEI